MSPALLMGRYLTLCVLLFTNVSGRIQQELECRDLSEPACPPGEMPVCPDGSKPRNKLGQGNKLVVDQIIVAATNAGKKAAAAARSIGAHRTDVALAAAKAAAAFASSSGANPTAAANMAADAARDAGGSLRDISIAAGLAAAALIGGSAPPLSLVADVAIAAAAAAGGTQSDMAAAAGYAVVSHGGSIDDACLEASMVYVMSITMRPTNFHPHKAVREAGGSTLDSAEAAGDAVAHALSINGNMTEVSTLTSAAVYKMMIKQGFSSLSAAKSAGMAAGTAAAILIHKVKGKDTNAVVLEAILAIKAQGGSLREMAIACGHVAGQFTSLIAGTARDAINAAQTIIIEVQMNAPKATRMKNVAIAAGIAAGMMAHEDPVGSGKAAAKAGDLCLHVNGLQIRLQVICCLAALDVGSTPAEAFAASREVVQDKGGSLRDVARMYCSVGCCENQTSVGSNSCTWANVTFVQMYFNQNAPTVAPSKADSQPTPLNLAPLDNMPLLTEAPSQAPTSTKAPIPSPPSVAPTAVPTGMPSSQPTAAPSKLWQGHVDDDKLEHFEKETDYHGANHSPARRLQANETDTSMTVSTVITDAAISDVKGIWCNISGTPGLTMATCSGLYMQSATNGSYLRSTGDGPLECADGTTVESNQGNSVSVPDPDVVVENAAPVLVCVSVVVVVGLVAVVGMQWHNHQVEQSYQRIPDSRTALEVDEGGVLTIDELRQNEV